MEKIGWSAVLPLIAQIIKLLLEHAQESRRQALLNEGKEIGNARAVHKSLQSAINLIGEANDARQSMRDHLNANPDRLREDDGFKRPDN